MEALCYSRTVQPWNILFVIHSRFSWVRIKTYWYPTVLVNRCSSPSDTVVVLAGCSYSLASYLASSSYLELDNVLTQSTTS